VYIKKCGLYVKQNIELRHSGRPKEMLHNTLHYKVSQFDNVLKIHVYQFTGGQNNFISIKYVV
jgi:hypothetical protein